MGVMAVQVPVSVGGMDVAPGEVIHMDENGAVKFPADKMENVLGNARALLEHEAQQLEALRKAHTASEVRAALSGAVYTNRRQ
jgi:regulator of RNase E activity RraA